MPAQALESPNEITQIIQVDQADVLDATALWLGKELAARGLTNTQIRAIFGTARQIEAKWRSSENAQNQAWRDLIMLKPKIAYQVARADGRVRPGIELLKEWIIPAIDAVNADNPSERDVRFLYFMQFFEAVLAYHYEAEAEKNSNQNRGSGRR